MPGLPFVVWPLLWRLARRSRPYGYLYQALLCWNLFTTYWLTLTALSAPALSEALISFLAGAVAIALNPLLMLLPFGVWRLLGRRLGLSVWLWIPLWVAFELFHWNWELSWSWLMVGLSWSEWPEVGRLGSLWGPVGLSAWTLIGAALWVEPQGRRWAAWVWILGWPTVINLLPEPTAGRLLRVYIVQPNIDPYAKFNEFPPQAQLDTLLRWLPPNPPLGSLILYPETAIPVAISLQAPQKEPFLQPFLAYVQRHQINLVLGVVGYRRFEKPEKAPPEALPLPTGEAYLSYNAALLIRPDTILVHVKRRLVPLVERVPYLERLTFLRTLEIDLGGDFGSFGKPWTLPTALPLFPDGTPLTVGICYESIFMQDLRKRLGSLIAILTNDGWWKKSSGYYQHYSYARLLALSLGRFVVRSANTGISTVISARGYPLVALPYNQSGRIEAQVESRQSRTIYGILGEWGAIFLSTFAVGIWTSRWYPWRPWRR